MANYKKFSKPEEIISHRRTELGISQSELARKLGYSNANFISIIESQRSKVPLDRSVEFAEALEIDAKWFVERVMRDRYPKIAEIVFKPGRK